jgi:hypothetical protein
MDSIRIGCILALLATLPLAAADPQPEPSKTQKMMESDTAKGLKSKALSKIGADFTPSPAGAKLYFIEPKNGAELKSPAKVAFGLSGMGVAPAGVQSDNTGHHHVLIDTELADVNQPLPKSDNVLHYGKGQTEAMVKLAPGKHTLQLVLGDWKHQPHSPPVVSEKITVTVK